MHLRNLLKLHHPGLLGLRTAIALIVLIHLLAGFLLLRLEINNSPELYVPADSPAAVLERSLRKEFPNDELLVGLFMGDELYSDRVITAMERVSGRLEKLPLVDRVISVTRMDHISATDDGFAVEPLIDPENLGASTPESRRARLLADRFAPGLLVARDGSALALAVRPKMLDDSRQRQDIEDAYLAAVRAEGLGGHLVALGGLVALDTAQLRSMEQDSIMFIPLVVVLGLQLLLWVVGRFPPMVIGAVAMGTVVVASISLLAILGQPYSLVSAILPSLLAAYTVATLLHLYAALMRARELGLRSPERVLYAVRKVHKPAVFNVLTTAAGMLSMVLTAIPPVQVFGIVGAFGTLMVYLVVFHLVPPLLVKWDRGRWPEGRSGFAWTQMLSLVVARFSIRHAPWVVGGVAVLVALGFPLLAKVQTESDLLKFFPADHPLTRSTDLIETQLAGVTALEIVVDGPGRDALKDVERLKAIKAVQQWVETLPEVDRTVSMMDIIEEMNWAFNGEDPEYRRLPDDDRLLSQLLLIYDGRDLNEFVNREYQRTRILLNLNVHGANAIQGVIGKIRAHLDSQRLPGVAWQIAGYGRLFSDQEDLLVVGQQFSFLGAFGQIFLILLFLWRSFPAAVICILPNLAPLYFIFMVMGSLGIPLDMATVLIASVVLGITVDDTIHLYHSYLYQRGKGHTPIVALERSIEISGRAVIAITLLLIVQFLLLAGSNFQPIANFGLLASAGLLSGQIMELLLLPALIVLWQGTGRGVGRPGGGRRA